MTRALLQNGTIVQEPDEEPLVYLGSSDEEEMKRAGIHAYFEGPDQLPLNLDPEAVDDLTILGVDVNG